MYSLVVLALLQLSPAVLVENTTLPWRAGLEQLNQQDMLVIKGVNPNSRAQLLVIRIDDENSHDYYSRANLERQVPSGEFELRISALGLKKENKQPLDIRHLKKIFVFNGGELPKTSIEISSISIEKTRSLPDFVHAYDFGGRESGVLEGAIQVTLAVNKQLDSGIELFGQMREIERPGPDPWIRDGIAGIEELRMPLDKGFWRIVIFREDIGEWENLPRQMDLRLSINGIEQPEKNSMKTASQWYQQQYLKFYDHTAKEDPWQDIIRHRGLVQSYDFEQSSEPLSIQLLGDSPQQRFISGIILQKLEDGIYQSVSNGLDLVNARREHYFHQHWLVEDKKLSINNNKIHKQSLRLAKGEGQLIEFDIQLEADSKPDWQSTFSDMGGYLEVRKALPRWSRQGSALHISKGFTHLTALKTSILANGNYRISIWLQAGNNQDAGQYDFKLGFKTKDAVIIQQLAVTIEVLDLVLPTNQQQVGIYLDHSPHLGFFKQWQSLQLAQVYCDLNYLDRLNLRALAPPLVTPTENNIQAWQQEIALYYDFYGTTDLLAYTPYKRLKKIFQKDVLQQKMAELVDKNQPGPEIYWSIADESLEQHSVVKQDAQQLHSANQFAKTAGHLNDKSQKGLIEHLDLVLINHGFGIDVEEIAEMHKIKNAKNNTNKRIWLYNMPNRRLAAGAFLWRSRADGYVQWHGRMPTANPYDPTDGREADYQFFYPQPRACEALPDVDRGLFELAMGQYELRWLIWLEQQQGEDAVVLKNSIEQQLGQTWQQAVKTKAHQLDHWHKQIINLAQSLIHPDKAKDTESNFSQLSGDFNDQDANTNQSDKMQFANNCIVHGGVRINTSERCQ